MQFCTVLPLDMLSGGGILKQLGLRAKAMDVHRMRIVPDEGLMRCELAKQVTAIFESEGIYAQIFSEGSRSTELNCCKISREDTRSLNQRMM
jgi:alcohol dehydrogenase class IV